MQIAIQYLVAAAVLTDVTQAPAQPPYPVRRLAPSAFSELPKNLAAELNRRKCTIPQPYVDRRANVIRGEFARAGQIDWAVLCSTHGALSLLVFWNGSSTNATELWKNPESPDNIFDWFIRPAGWNFIMKHYRAYGGPNPPPIDHYGIESGSDRASVVLYYFRGKWLQLQGAD